MTAQRVHFNVRPTGPGQDSPAWLWTTQSKSSDPIQKTHRFMIRTRKTLNDLIGIEDSYLEMGGSTGEGNGAGKGCWGSDNGPDSVGCVIGGAACSPSLFRRICQPPPKAR